MNKKEFYNYIDTPESLDKLSLADISSLVKDYPYCQTAHLLLLQNLHNLEDIEFEKQLKSSALFIADRKKLFYLVKPKQVEIETKSEEIELPEVKITEQKEDIVEKVVIPVELIETKEETKVPEEPVKAKEEIKIPEPPKEEVKVPEQKEEEIKVVEERIEPVKIQEPEKEKLVEKAMETKPESEKEKPIEEPKEVKPEPIITEIKKTEIKVEEKSIQEPKETKKSIADLILEKHAKLKGKTDKTPVEEPKKETVIEKKPPVEKKELPKPEPVPKITQSTKPVEKQPVTKEPVEQVKAKEETKISEQPKEEKKQEKPAPVIKPPEVKKEIKPVEKKTEPKEKEVIPVNETHSFSEWLNILTKDTKQKETSDTDNKDDDLINRFIEKNPTIPKPGDTQVTYTEISDPSEKLNDDLFSETLANIYLKQKHFEEAIKIYQKLMLHYPEKSSYFAARIEEIKSKIK